MKLTDTQKQKIEELRALREDIEELINGVQPINIIAERERAEALVRLFDEERELEDELGDEIIDLLEEEADEMYRDDS